MGVRCRCKASSSLCSQLELPLLQLRLLCSRVRFNCAAAAAPPGALRLARCLTSPFFGPALIERTILASAGERVLSLPDSGACRLDSSQDTAMHAPSSFRFLDLALRARFPHAPLITIVIIVLALRSFAVDVQSLPSIFRRFEVCSDSLWSFHPLVPTSRTSFAWSEWPDRRCRSYERHSDGSLPVMRRCCAAPSSLVADASIKIPHDASSPPSRPSLREQHAAYLEPLSRHFSTLGQRSSFDLVAQRARHGDRSGDPDDMHGVPVATLTPSTMRQRQPRHSQRPRASTAAPLPVTSRSRLSTRDVATNPHIRSFDVRVLGSPAITCVVPMLATPDHGPYSSVLPERRTLGGASSTRPFSHAGVEIVGDSLLFASDRKDPLRWNGLYGVWVDSAQRERALPPPIQPGASSSPLVLLISPSLLHALQIPRPTLPLKYTMQPFSISLRDTALLPPFGHVSTNPSFATMPQLATLAASRVPRRRGHSGVVWEAGNLVQPSSCLRLDVAASSSPCTVSRAAPRAAAVISSALLDAPRSQLCFATEPSPLTTSTSPLRSSSVRLSSLVGVETDGDEPIAATRYTATPLSRLPQQSMPVRSR
ncbi:hypothetical protein B0H15DRAFT_958327 [Mycena belliarum]|uniref:Uncharacterized protein n=1 Tax=Mycena belliarum TaxID=1033014 RepID=A0AAD6TR38_9AGAR|nr:hypothetical protein B0H15DRAFT_958327 [Mycena belliae]